MDEEIFNLETAEFPHSIDLEALQRETGLSLQQIAAKLGKKSYKALYKWNYPKSQNGTRPPYEALCWLLQAGASTKTLFGVAQSNAVIPPKVNGSNISLSDLANFFAEVAQKLAEKDG